MIKIAKAIRKGASCVTICTKAAQKEMILPTVLAVVGDTVGDSFKDTSGPSINILIKLLSMVSIVFAAFIMANTFFR